MINFDDVTPGFLRFWLMTFIATPDDPDNPDSVEVSVMANKLQRAFIASATNEQLMSVWQSIKHDVAA